MKKFLLKIIEKYEKNEYMPFEYHVPVVPVHKK
jgi:hypothetical protein